MKKLLFTVIALIMACCSLFAIGCKDDTKGGAGDVKMTDENSYVVSFYLSECTQGQDGKIKEEGYTFWKSVQVLKTKMIELEGYDKQYFYYSYTGGSVKISGDKGYFLANSDATIYARKRQLKTISFYVKSGDVYLDAGYGIGSKEMEEYKSTFVNTYEEKFSISSTMFNLFKNKVYVPASQIKVELYLNRDCMGTPFFTCNSYNCEMYKFTLIKSTNVYVKVSAL